MAEPANNNLVIPGWVNQIQRFRNLFVPIAFISLLLVIVVPLPPMIMDLLITANIALAALILMTTVFIEKPLDFSVFPSLLLATTLLRLVLNIATTRLILSADTNDPGQATAVAGRVIQQFAEFVAGNQLVVGIVLFLILIIVQFIVITKGATRISEVAARFTLDGMPGKQMAIDADLNAGIINDKQAKARREEIAQEADFYGAMDGASKFVRGDAIAGIIITLVNIIGGFAIGVWQKGWTAAEAAEVFTKLTIGDGLVSQLPAFIIAVASGLIVTRSSSRQELGIELSGQLASRWQALAITAGFLGLMSLTGLPMLPMILLATVLGVTAFMLRRNDLNREVMEEQAKAQEKKEQGPPPVEQALTVDTLELEVGYGLVRMVDTSQGGDLLDRISMIRRQLAGDMGLVMPPVRIRDNMQHQPNEYHIKIRGNTVATGAVYPGRFLAMDSGLASPDTAPLEGTPTHEPAFGLPAVWIDAGQRERAEALNYTVVDPTSVLATHITEVVKNHASELLTREETNNLIVQIKEKAPKLVEEVIGDSDKQGLIKPGELQKVLQNLLSERVPIRDMEVIIETLGDWAPRTRDLEVLTEYVRNALRRTICNQYVMQANSALPHENDSFADSNIAGDGGPARPRLYCVSLDPALEDQINGFIERTAEGTTMSMPPAIANQVTAAIIRELQRLIEAGHQPVVLASPQVRAQVRRLLEPHLPNAAVLGYNEISKGIEVESLGLAQLEPASVTSQYEGATT